MNRVHFFIYTIFVSQTIKQLVEDEDCAAYYVDSEARK